MKTVEVIVGEGQATLDGDKIKIVNQEYEVEEVNLRFIYSAIAGCVAKILADQPDRPTKAVVQVSGYTDVNKLIEGSQEVDRFKIVIIGKVSLTKEKLLEELENCSILANLFRTAKLDLEVLENSGRPEAKASGNPA